MGTNQNATFGGRERAAILLSQYYVQHHHQAETDK